MSRNHALSDTTSLKKFICLTNEVYLRIFRTVVKFRRWTVSLWKPHVFQKDDAQAHISHLAQYWLSNNFDMLWPKEFCP